MDTPNPRSLLSSVQKHADALAAAQASRAQQMAEFSSTINVIGDYCSELEDQNHMLRSSNSENLNRIAVLERDLESARSELNETTLYFDETVSTLEDSHREALDKAQAEYRAELENVQVATSAIIKTTQDDCAQTVAAIRAELEEAREGSLQLNRGIGILLTAIEANTQAVTDEENILMDMVRKMRERLDKYNQPAISDVLDRSAEIESIHQEIENVLMNSAEVSYPGSSPVFLTANVDFSDISDVVATEKVA